MKNELREHDSSKVGSLGMSVLKRGKVLLLLTVDIVPAFSI